MVTCLRSHWPGLKSETGCRAGIMVATSSPQLRRPTSKTSSRISVPAQPGGVSPGNGSDSAPASTDGDDGRRQPVQVNTDAKLVVEYQRQHGTHRRCSERDYNEPRRPRTM